MANAENIALVIRSITGEIAEYSKRVGFNMGTYVSDVAEQISDLTGRNCATVACLAGHAYLLARQFNIQEAKEADPDDIESIAADFIGIDAQTAALLFYDLPDGIALNAVTPASAIETLTRLVETDRIEWRIQ